MHSPETLLPSSHERMGPTSCLELEPTSSASRRKYSIVRNYTITFPENTSILQHDPSSMHLSLLEPWPMGTLVWWVWLFGLIVGLWWWPSRGYYRFQYLCQHWLSRCWKNTSIFLCVGADQFSTWARWLYFSAAIAAHLSIWVQLSHHLCIFHLVHCHLSFFSLNLLQFFFSKLWRFLKRLIVWSRKTFLDAKCLNKQWHSWAPRLC